MVGSSETLHVLHLIYVFLFINYPLKLRPPVDLKRDLKCFVTFLMQYYSTWHKYHKKN